MSMSIQNTKNVVIRCFWGDELVLDVAESNDGLVNREIREKILEMCPSMNTSDYYIYVQENINENINDDEKASKEWVAIALPSNGLLVLDRPKLMSMFGHSWLAKCVHPKLIEFYVSQHKKQWYSAIWANPHQYVVQHLLNCLDQVDVVPAQLSKNPSDEILDWLEKHPSHINYSDLVTNPNPRVVNMLKKVIDDSKVLTSREWCMCTHDEIASEVWKRFGVSLFGFREWRMNDSEFVVTKQLELLNLHTISRWTDFMPKLSGSRHAMAVQFYVDHVGNSSIAHELWSNPSEIAVHFALQLPRKSHYLFCQNAHESVVNYYVNHPELIVWPEFLSNSNTIAVKMGIDWLTDEMQKSHTNVESTTRIAYHVLLNRNPIMIEFVVKHCTKYLNLSSTILHELVAEASDLLVILKDD